MNDDILIQMLKQLEYQTKLLETMVESIDESHKKNQKNVAQLKLQSMDMISKILGNHPITEKLKQTGVCDGIK